jgi:hypothetical protein
LSEPGTPIPTIPYNPDQGFLLEKRVSVDAERNLGAGT